MADQDTLSYAPGNEGPGLEPSPGYDWTVWPAGILALIGWTPIAWWEAALGTAYFGPLAFPAICAMVGVLFVVIGLLRGLDTKDVRSRPWLIGAGAIGMARLFVLPLF